MPSLPIQKTRPPQAQIKPETFNPPMWNLPTLAGLLQRLSFKESSKTPSFPRD
jgi:hypothetical protein